MFIKVLCWVFEAIMSCTVVLVDESSGWSILLQVVGGSEHTLRAKLTFSQELHGIQCSIVTVLTECLKDLFSLMNQRICNEYRKYHERSRAS